MAVQERGYTPQLGPAETARLPTAGADAFGAQVGQSIAQLGGAIQAARDDQQSTEFAASSAQWRSDVEQQIIDMRANAQPGAAGHADAAKAIVDDPATREKLLSGISDRQLRRRAEGQIADFANRVTTREYEYQAVQQAAKVVGDAGRFFDISANRVRHSTDPAAYAEETARVEEYIQSLKGISEDQRAKASDDAAATLAVARVNGMIDQGQAPAALAQIKAGAFDALLDPRQVEALTNVAEVQIRTDASQAKAAATQALTQQKNVLSAAEADADASRPDPKVYWQLAQGWSGVPGEEERAIRAKAKGDAIAAAESYRGASPAERDARVAALRAMPQRTAAEESELKGLAAQKSYVDQLDAVGRLQYATGSEPPRLDLSDPAATRTWVAYAEAAQQRFGGLVSLPAETMAVAKDIARSGSTDAKIGLAQSLLQLPPKYARSAMDQIGAGDENFTEAMKLAPHNDGGERMRMALAGPDALRGHPNLLTPAKDDAGLPIGILPRNILSELSPAFQGMDPSFAASVRVNAQNIYLSLAARKGLSNFDEPTYRQALRYALGGNGQRGGGGIATWRGGLFVPPRGMTQADTDWALSRATGEDWRTASVGAQIKLPKGANIAGIDLIPVYVGGSIYKLRQGNSFVTNEAGGQYRFDMTKLPRRPAR